MKNFKKSIQTLTGVLLFFVLIKIISCTKKTELFQANPGPGIPDTSGSHQPQPPTISFFSPESGGTGDTISIQGTNFNEIYNVIIAGRPVKTFITISNTHIKAVIGKGDKKIATVEINTTAGKGVKNGFSYISYKIDGYDSSLQVAADREIAYWSGDNSVLASGGNDPSCDCPRLFKEEHSNLNPLVSVRAYTGKEGDAIYGKAMFLRDGYMIYPPIPNLNTPDALSSYTVSMWVQAIESTAGNNSLFQLSSTHSPDYRGQVQITDSFYYEPLWGDVFGTIQVHHAQNTPSGAISDDWNLFSETIFSSGDWSHWVLTYEGSTRVLSFYVDGLLIGSKISSIISPSSGFWLESPVQALFGTFAFREDGFNQSISVTDNPTALHGITTGLDEVRVFNAALSEKEILALTHLGQAQR